MNISKILNKFGVFWCKFIRRQHEFVLISEPHRIYLQCMHCQKATEGWMLEEDGRMRRSWVKPEARYEDMPSSKEDFKQVFDEMMEVELGLGTGG